MSMFLMSPMDTSNLSHNFTMIAKALKNNNINLLHFHITNSQLSSNVFTYILVCWWDLWKTFCSLQSHICECCKWPWKTRTDLQKKSQSLSTRQNERGLRKHFMSFLVFSLRVINHNINTSNNSGWNTRKKAKKINRRLEQLSEAYPGHCVLELQCLAFGFTWTSSTRG